MIHRLAALLVVAVAVAGLAATPAQASWSSAGAGAGRQVAMTMSAGNAPTVTMASATVLGLGVVRTYTLTWPRSDVSSGTPVTGYRITRTSTLGPAVLGTGTCTGITVVGLGLPAYVPANPSASTQSCTDISTVDLGVVRYAITPVYGNWTGSPSAPSTPVS